MGMNLYAQDGSGVAVPAQQGGSLLSMAFPFILMIGVFYLLIIRPQQKQKKMMQQMLDALKVNDKVLTSSGIYGKVTSINDDKGFVIIRVDEATNTKMTFQKSAIVNVLTPDTNEDDNA